MIKTNKKFGLIITIVCTVMLSLGLTAGPGNAKEVDTLRIGIGIDADTLNPLELTTAIPANLSELIHDRLLLPGPGGKFLPNLVTEWSVSEDGKVYTFKLREGVKFTDGAPFTTETLKKNLELMQNPDIRVPLRFIFAAIDHLEVVDDYTAKYYLKAPFAPFLSVMTVMMPMSQKAVEPYDGQKLSQHPVGVGPFKLAEWVKGERIVLERNDDYWGQKPTVKKVVYQIVPETATRVAMLRAGQLDVIYSPTPADVPALMADPNIEMVKPLSTRMMFVGMNTQKGVTKDKRVRQAFNYAIDKKTITEKILFGVAQPLDAPLPPSIFGYKKAPFQYDYDPEKAKALLKEANFPADAEVHLITPTGRYTYDKQVAEAVQAYLADIGVKADLRTYDWPTYMGITSKPLDVSEVELYLSGWGWPLYDADPYYLIYFSSFVHPPKGLNCTFFTNPDYDKLVGWARTLMDPVKREEVYAQAGNMLWDDAPAIWLYVEPYAIAFNKKFKGLVIQPNERSYPTYVTTE